MKMQQLDQNIEINHLNSKNNPQSPQKKPQTLKITHKCIGGNILKLFCVNKSCKNKGNFICNDDQCPCNENHSKCKKFSVKTVLIEIHQKIDKNKNYLKLFKDQISEKFTCIVDEISQNQQIIQYNMDKDIKIEELTDNENQFFQFFYGYNKESIKNFNGEKLANLVQISQDDKKKIKQPLKKEELLKKNNEILKKYEKMCLQSIETTSKYYSEIMNLIRSKINQNNLELKLQKEEPFKFQSNEIVSLKQKIKKISEQKQKQTDKLIQQNSTVLSIIQSLNQELTNSQRKASECQTSINRLNQANNKNNTQINQLTRRIQLLTQTNNQLKQKSDQINQTNNQLKESNTQLNETINALNLKLSEKQSKIISINNQLKQSNTQLNETINALNLKLSEKQSKITRINNQLQKVKKQKSNLQGSAKYLRSQIYNEINKFQNVRRQLITLQIKKGIRKYDPDPFLSSLSQSSIINDQKKIENLLNFFNQKKIKSLKLCFASSQFYFNIIQKYYQKCGNLTHTIIICQTQKGKIIGGYTPLCFNSTKKAQTNNKNNLNEKMSQIQQKHTSRMRIRTSIDQSSQSNIFNNRLSSGLVSPSIKKSYQKVNDKTRSSFLFSLTNNDKFQLDCYGYRNNEPCAIKRDLNKQSIIFGNMLCISDQEYNKGSYFDLNDTDDYLVNKKKLYNNFNKFNSINISKNPRQYQNNKQSYLALTGYEDKYFKIKQWEVLQVQFTQ